MLPLRRAARPADGPCRVGPADRDGDDGDCLDAVAAAGLPGLRGRGAEPRPQAAGPARRAAWRGPGPVGVAATHLAVPGGGMPARDVRRAGPDAGHTTRPGHHARRDMGDRAATSRARHHRRAGASARCVVVGTVASGASRARTPRRGRVPLHRGDQSRGGRAHAPSLPTTARDARRARKS